MTSMDNTDAAAAKGRFDRLFSLCAQELRQKAKRTPNQDAATAQDAESFRQAAIHSLLQRPAF